MCGGKISFGEKKIQYYTLNRGANKKSGLVIQQWKQSLPQKVSETCHSLPWQAKVSLALFNKYNVVTLNVIFQMGLFSNVKVEISTVLFNVLSCFKL